MNFIAEIVPGEREYASSVGTTVVRPRASWMRGSRRAPSWGPMVREFMR
jgi:hypothetical protein